MRGSLHLPSLIGSGFPRSLSFAGRRLLHLNDNKNKRALSSSSLRDYGLLRQRGKREFKPQIPFLSTSSSQLCIRGFSSDEKISSVENNEKALAFFESLENLHPLSKQALEKAGWKQMTDIQAQTWDPILAGSDVIGRAHTGTGKTLAFLLPGLERLLQKPRNPNQISILVLSPTRELALQTASQATILTSAHGKNGIVCQEMVGGTNKRYDLGRIKKHGVPAILVATPGQLLAHLRNSRIDENTPFAALFKSIQTVAIDEADKLLDMGFSEDICEILSFCPPPDKRQTLLFSATFSQKVNEMVKYACKPDVITIDCVGDKEDPTRQPVPEKVDQSYVTIPMSRVFSAPIEVVANLTDNKKKRNVKIIAFFPTRHHVQLYEDIFNYRLGRRVLAIHKEMPQSTRTSTSDLFRHAKNAVLLTTDASARGLDYKGVTHVLQFGIPYDKDSYIHRIGRTSRAKKEGKAILVLSAEEEQFVQQVLIGFDLRVNSDFQSLLNGPMEPSVDDAIADMAVEVNDKRERNLRQMIVDTGTAMKAYYQSRRRQLNLDMSDEYLNQMSHTFMNQAGVKSLPRNQVPTSKPWSPGDPFDVGHPVSKSRK